jgi:hypothetical protein
VRALGRGSVSAWSPIAYRRILALVRLRNAGLRRTTRLRVGLWLAGHRLDPEDVVRDFKAEVARAVHSALGEMGVERFSYRPDGLRPRLRIVRQVQAMASLEPRDLFGAADLSVDQETALRRLIRDPVTHQAFQAMVELMVEGHRPGAMSRLEAVVPLLPPGLIDNADIKEMTAPLIGAVAPDDENNILHTFALVTYPDLERAREFLREPSRLGVLFCAAGRAIRQGGLAAALSESTREVLAAFFETYPLVIRSSEEARLFMTALLAAGNALRRTGRARHWVPAVIEELPA